MSLIIWVVCQADARGLRDGSLEVLGEARALADELTGRVHALLLWTDVSALVEPARRQDVDVIYRLQHPSLLNYHPEAWVTALASFLSQQPPGLVLISATTLGRELAPRLATRLRAPLVSECVWVKPGPARDIRLVRPTYAGQFHATYSFPPGGWIVASLRPGVVGIAAPIRCRVPEIVDGEIDISDEQMFIRGREVIPGDPRRIHLNEAERIVAGGRGVKDKSAWETIEDTAEALEAAVGGSRAAMDLGYVPRERMIGQTGTSVKPRLYLAAGISGISHHLAGVQAEHLIAINLDRGAGIFRQATLGIIGDLHEILPRLAARVRSLKGQEKGGAP